MPKDTKAVPSAAAPQALAGGRCCMELSCAAPAALPSGFLNISPLAFYNSCDGGSQSFLALGKLDELRVESAAAFPLLREYVSESADWVFGVLSYELKNELENLHSTNPDELQFPMLHFFRPEVVVHFSQGLARAFFHAEHTGSGEVSELLKHLSDGARQKAPVQLRLKSRITRQAYLEKVGALQEHIRLGDVYEANFCQEFYTRDADIAPVDVFNRLVTCSPMPFSAYYRDGDSYLLCASPERFLKKEGERIISQPIKGTVRRGKDEEEDRALRDILLHSVKERGENVMIVDLVRNDLSRMSLPGSVQVDELCGIYTFRGLHQMISTVSARIKPGVHPVDVIEAAFPMGSMTGAPKISAMQLIDRYEDFSRGWFSGSVGYFTPSGDFDFNVVIRSLLYNARKKYLSMPAGGAITALSDPQDEYRESLLKLEAVIEALGAEMPA